MSEFSGKKHRGMMVSLVFAMQAAGLIVGPLLAFGAIPALAVFHMRRHMAESPRYLLATGQHDDARAAAGHVLGEGHAAARDGRATEKTSFIGGFVAQTRRRNIARRLIGASAAWFLMDFAHYGNTVSSPLVKLFPVAARTTGHGIASATGKLVGFVGVFLFPILLSAGGLLAAESMAAAVSVLGILVTVFMLPETKNKSLEELSIEDAGTTDAAASAT
jgi:hypothetical protein